MKLEHFDKINDHHIHYDHQHQQQNDYYDENIIENLRLRISVSSHQGGRKYMEDEFIIMHYKPSPVMNGKNDIMNKSFIFLGIFDGHGGDMAARYTKQNLCRNIIRQRRFWCNDNDDEVCLAIHKGFVRTQKEMMREVEKWPRTTTGLLSTSGTTASVLFIMNGKYYTGHVGDSRIVLGRKTKNSTKWQAHPMTRDHKPESPRELKRIEATGGQVINKSGISRVVWNRPRRIIRSDDSTIQVVYDLIPFLSVARSLGDLWSLNRRLNKFIVSPEPDVKCIEMDMYADKCLILASDGLWNMINLKQAVKIVQEYEEKLQFDDCDDDENRNQNDFYTNQHKQHDIIYEPERSHSLELFAAIIDRWIPRADNTTVVVVMFDQLLNQEQKIDDRNSHNDRQMVDPYEFFDVNSNDSNESIHSSSSTSSSSPSKLSQSMIGDTIHTFECFNRHQTDENFLEIKSKDIEEIESLMNDLLDSISLNDDTNINDSELLDDEQISSIQMTIISSDLDTNNPNISKSIYNLQQQSTKNNLLTSNNYFNHYPHDRMIYKRTNFNYSFYHNNCTNYQLSSSSSPSSLSINNCINNHNQNSISEMISSQSSNTISTSNELILSSSNRKRKKISTDSDQQINHISIMSSIESDKNKVIDLIGIDNHNNNNDNINRQTINTSSNTESIISLNQSIKRKCIDENNLIEFNATTVLNGNSNNNTTANCSINNINDIDEETNNGLDEIDDDDDDEDEDIENDDEEFESSSSSTILSSATAVKATKTTINHHPLIASLMTE